MAEVISRTPPPRGDRPGHEVSPHRTIALEGPVVRALELLALEPLGADLEAADRQVMARSPFASGAGHRVHRQNENLASPDLNLGRCRADN